MSCCQGKEGCCDEATARSKERARRQRAAASAKQKKRTNGSRYPDVSQMGHSWAVAAPPAAPQFEGCWPPENTGESDPPLPPFTFAGEHLAACNFPLGGFAAGQVHFQGDGTLQGWHVLNQEDTKGDMAPAPSQNVPACFFAASASVQGQQPQNFLLATPQNYTQENCGLPSYYEAHVTPEAVERLQNLPGIRSLTLTGRYPIADVAYDIPGFPVQLSLEAMSPMVPGEAQNSAFPAAVFTFTARNASQEDVSLRLMQAQMNFVGWDGVEDALGGDTPFWGGNVNTPFSADGLAGLAMSSTSVKLDAATYGTLCVGAVATSDDAEYVVVGQDGGNQDTIAVIAEASSEDDLWQKFVAGTVTSPSGTQPTSPSPEGESTCGGVVHSVVVPAGASKTVTFILSWHFANRLLSNGLGNYKNLLPANLGARYATWFEDAHAVAKAIHAKSDYLLSTTRLYRDTVYDSTMPENIILSAAGRASLLGCPTTFWTKDGIVLGFEGNHCCPLNCTHVWGYGVLLERLFPEIAQDMQYSAFVRTFNDENGVSMRYGLGGYAIDGAFACIIKAFLAVQQGDGSLTWLPKVWPHIKKMLDIVFTHFDVDGDGCIRGAQQNTYDSAMFGANTFIGSYYVTALRAAGKMARLMGEPDLAGKYERRAALSSTNYEKICWKEDFGYYVADVTIKDCQFSFGPGCFIDQLCAAGLSFACGLGYMFNQAHEAQARSSISKNNIVRSPPFKDFQKHFFPGDLGHTTCTYPHGKLGKGMMYDTLVSIGWTYPVVAGLLHDRSVDDATSMNDMLRQRQDGRNRSPWNEPECNTHYSRMLSGWGLYDQACGLLYDSTQGFLAFDPRFNVESFSSFFSADGGWGKFAQEGISGLPSGTVTLSALHGSFALKRLGVYSFTKPDACTAALDGKEVAASLTKDAGAGVAVCFEPGLTLNSGSTLKVSLRTKTGLAVGE